MALTLRARNQFLSSTMAAVPNPPSTFVAGDTIVNRSSGVEGEFWCVLRGGPQPLKVPALYAAGVLIRSIVAMSHRVRRGAGTHVAAWLMSLERFVSADHVAIIGILDLQQGCETVLATVASFETIPLTWRARPHDALRRGFCGSSNGNRELMRGVTERSRRPTLCAGNRGGFDFGLDKERASRPVAVQENRAARDDRRATLRRVLVRIGLT
jgi:hypothetical protein